MIKVELEKSAKNNFTFTLSENGDSFVGGLKEGFIFVDEKCPYKELMLRAVINKCMNDFVFKIKAKDEWEVDLTKFGFKDKGEYFEAALENLKLPHLCHD